MAKDKATMQSWQVLHYARKHLGRSLLYKIFGKKNTRAVDYWCEDPKYTGKGDGAYDPIQGVRNLLEALDDSGHCAVVRACVAYLCHGTDYGCGIEPVVKDTKATLIEEILADYRAVADMQTAIDNEASEGEVYKLKLEAVDEIERTFAKYLEDKR